MTITDEQLDRLEDCLDGALAPDEADAIRQLLADDAEMARALESLRTERSLRMGWLKSLEPSVLECNRLEANVHLGVRRERMRTGTWRALRLGTVAAALVAVAFSAGWLAHDRSLARGGSSAGVVAAGGNSGARPTVATVYEVQLTDEQGNVTAVQTFSSVAAAREFADDLARWQQRQRAVRRGAAVVVADKF